MSKKLEIGVKECSKCEYYLRCEECVGSHYKEEIPKLNKKIAELEQRLSNCIEPKFKVGQEVWCISFMKIIKFKIDKIEIYRGETEEENRILYGNWEDMIYQIEKNVFSTLAEAKKKLGEMGK